MSIRVIFTPESRRQLADLFHYISGQGNPDTAARYVDEIIGYCESLCTFPHRGVMRYDIRPGLRMTHYKKRTMIAFHVDESAVSIIGIFYGGQDYQSLLEISPEDDET